MDTAQILETIKMISEENLDIRTITMGISLLDCIDSDSDKACQKIYDKITTKAKDLVKVGNQIATEYGIPVINKRVSVTPISLIAAASKDKDYVKYAKALDKAAPPRVSPSNFVSTTPSKFSRSLNSLAVFTAS